MAASRGEARAVETGACAAPEAGRAPGADRARIPGEPSGRYRAVPRTLVFVRHGERILLQRRAPDRAIWPGRYNGVGGHLEPGEGVAACARREVREETGLAVRDLRLAGLMHVTDGSRTEGVVVAVFTARSDTSDVLESAEGDLAWVALDEVAGLDVVPDLAAILPRLWPEGREAPFLAVSRLGDGPTTVASAAAWRPDGDPFFIE
jgi:8-oxo-dGTP diphosphatase